MERPPNAGRGDRENRLHRNAALSAFPACRCRCGAYAAEEVVGLCAWRDRGTFFARGDWRAMSLAAHALIPLGRPKQE